VANKAVAFSRQLDRRHVTHAAPRGSSAMVVSCGEIEDLLVSVVSLDFLLEVFVVICSQIHVVALRNEICGVEIVLQRESAVGVRGVAAIIVGVDAVSLLDISLRLVVVTGTIFSPFMHFAPLSNPLPTKVVRCSILVAANVNSNTIPSGEGRGQ